MPRLLALAEDFLIVGDMVRLSDNYDLGPGSGPVDLLVFDPHDSAAGLGLMVASGYKAGLVLAVLPAESLFEKKRAISKFWLIENWDKWFVFTYQGGPVPIVDTVILRWNERMTVETCHADRRPA
ncbi:Imm45 family immunity protein [Mesorhizobium sp. ES1-1]|uniref:Imm45 family immunity protein n=1 Tax=Mesorhizobium sp. ES1-1 TaxID=2876629 RepID=UPI001CCE1735|nr:Imm45 family immunity protein [Mesorhizobium sp. ES1-1]MBZ9676558.1 immunity 45 family protein [Mesorhizobium sp. ES1-1]